MGVFQRIDKVSELIGEPSWADAIAAIEKAGDLWPDQKTPPADVTSTDGGLPR
jgi:hypothetical protein